MGCCEDMRPDRHPSHLPRRRTERNFWIAGFSFTLWALLAAFYKLLMQNMILEDRLHMIEVGAAQSDLTSQRELSPSKVSKLMRPWYYNGTHVNPFHFLPAWHAFLPRRGIGSLSRTDDVMQETTEVTSKAKPDAAAPGAAGPSRPTAGGIQMQAIPTEYTAAGVKKEL